MRFILCLSDADITVTLLCTAHKLQGISSTLEVAAMENKPGSWLPTCLESTSSKSITQRIDLMARQDLYNQRGSYSDHSDSIAPQPSYASDNAWMHTRSDSHGPNAALRGPTPPDVFSKLSAAIPDLRPLDSGARAATRAEQKITFLGGCRLYPKAMAWSMAISSTIIMEGFDTLLIFSFFSHPTFRRAYGVSTGNGNYEIPTRWQFALPTAAEAGEIVGLLLSGVVADRIGYRFTLAAALIFLFLSVFLSFFAVSLELLLAGQILCGIPWGVFQTLSINYAGM